MELKRHTSDLTDTSKRALATNRGQSETLKSTYETLESEYKTKCNNLNAEQARFVRLMKNKLPAIKVSNDQSESGRPRFLTPPNSPLVRQKMVLPALNGSSHGRRRSKSFSDLSQSLGVHEQGRMSRQKSFEQLDDKLTEQRTNFSSTRPRSLSAIDPPSNFPGKCRNDDKEEKFFGNGVNKHLLTNWLEPTRKHSSPAKLSPVHKNHIHETRKLTSEKPLGKQLEDVKDLRYLRTGKYTTSETIVTEGNMGAQLS